MSLSQLAQSAWLEPVDFELCELSPEDSLLFVVCLFVVLGCVFAVLRCVFAVLGCVWVVCNASSNTVMRVLLQCKMSGLLQCKISELC